jgi:hypothetical protein
MSHSVPENKNKNSKNLELSEIERKKAGRKSPNGT